MDPAVSCLQPRVKVISVLSVKLARASDTYCGSLFSGGWHPVAMAMVFQRKRVQMPQLICLSEGFLDETGMMQVGMFCF